MVLLFCMWLSCFPNSIYGRDYSLSILCSWLLCHKLIEHTGVGLFLGLLFFSSICVLVVMLILYCFHHCIFVIRSDQISHSVMSDSLRPHESQHARPPCPSPTPGVHWDSRPSSRMKLENMMALVLFLFSRYFGHLLSFVVPYKF